MAFLNKLRDKVTEVAKAKELFDDPVFFQYYEITFGLLLSIYTATYDGIKNYIEYWPKEKCDEDCLLKVLEHFSVYENPLDENAEKLYSIAGKHDIEKLYTNYGLINAKKVEKLLEINSKMKEAEQYKCDQWTALEICYTDVIKKVKMDFNETVKLLEHNAHWRHFEDGIDRIRYKYSPFVGEEASKIILYKTVVESYFDCNYVTMQSLLELAVMKIKSTFLSSNPADSICTVSSLALRVVNYNKSILLGEAYTDLTFEQCKEFVIQSEVFKPMIDKYPLDREKMIDGYAKRIKFARFFTLIDYDLYEMDMLFIDSVCNFVWKIISQESDSINVESIKSSFDCTVNTFEIMYNFFQNV